MEIRALRAKILIIIWIRAKIIVMESVESVESVGSAGSVGSVGSVGSAGSIGAFVMSCEFIVVYI